VSDSSDRQVNPRRPAHWRWYSQPPTGPGSSAVRGVLVKAHRVSSAMSVPNLSRYSGAPHASHRAPTAEMAVGSAIGGPVKEAPADARAPAVRVFTTHVRDRQILRSLPSLPETSVRFRGAGAQGSRAERLPIDLRPGTPTSVRQAPNRFTYSIYSFQTGCPPAIHGVCWTRRTVRTAERRPQSVVRRVAVAPESRTPWRLPGHLVPALSLAQSEGAHDNAWGQVLAANGGSPALRSVHKVSGR